MFKEPVQLLCYLPLFPSVRVKSSFCLAPSRPLKTTIPGDMFNIPLCTSDIFFCMKSDICPVNILQLPLCTKKHFILWPRKWCLGGVSLQGLQPAPRGPGLTKSHSDPYRTEGGGQGGLREERGEEKRERYVKEGGRWRKRFKESVIVCSPAERRIHVCSRTLKNSIYSSAEKLSSCVPNDF